MAALQWRVGLKCVEITVMALCATIDGMFLMPEWPAGNWDFLIVVSAKVMNSCKIAYLQQMPYHLVAVTLEEEWVK